jgi:methylmalonyl-CoA/ethylmalonyl-CoA epimerase
MFEKVDHIAIAVEDLDRAIETYATVLGLQAQHREYVEDYGVEIATLTIGDTAIELLEGKSEESPIRKFVETRGPGLHHVAFVVDDIRETLDTLRADGVKLIDETPRRGKDNSLVAFIHPKATERVLYELVQLGAKD